VRLGRITLGSLTTCGFAAAGVRVFFADAGVRVFFACAGVCGLFAPAGADWGSAAACARVLDLLASPGALGFFP